jgi:hypothetical protein
MVGELLLYHREESMIAKRSIMLLRSPLQDFDPFAHIALGFTPLFPNSDGPLFDVFTMFHNVKMLLYTIFDICHTHCRGNQRMIIR